MNREIRFRVWDGEKMWEQGQEDTCITFYGQEKKIPWGVYNNVEERRLITGDPKAVFNTLGVLMQFTGLFDRRKKPIYEGDIIRYHSHKGYLLNDFIASVVWYESGWAYLINDDKIIFSDLPNMFSEHDEIENDFLNFVEVIGNIYQNPEILKKY